MNHKEILTQAILRWGRTEQCLVACEEMGELMQAISKLIRNHDDSKIQRLTENLIEELSDVSIMLQQVQLIFGVTNEDFDTKYQNKMAELAEKLGMEE
jgi:NTP pyrophosphatase (non-canonical NTP hydrolase)